MRKETFLSTAKAAYSKYVPRSIRRSKFVTHLKQFLPHDLLYDEKYFLTDVDPPAVKAAAVMAAAVVRDLAPRNLMDFGCGTGALLVALRDQGCTGIGLEYADAALRFCRSRGLDVRKFDLERDELQSLEKCDVVISMEVAEHLPERVADRFVTLLTSLAPVVVFTAAYPGQGGMDHINEQPASYWIAKFNARRFYLDSALIERWRNEWQAAGVAVWYWENIMIFRVGS